MDRYEAYFMPNTKQWWIYDGEEDVYIDPPTEVLDKVDELFAQDTADSMDEARDYLENICNNEQPDWLNEEEYWYDDEDL